MAGPHLRSHHSRVEAPEADRQHFRLDSNTAALSLAPDDEALGVGSIGWDLIGPRVALLESHPVVFSKPWGRQRRCIISQRYPLAGTGQIPDVC